MPKTLTPKQEDFLAPVLDGRYRRRWPGIDIFAVTKVTYSW